MQSVSVIIVSCTVNLCNLTLSLFSRMPVNNNRHESKLLLRESLLIHSFYCAYKVVDNYCWPKEKKTT